jgi:hypothetical protein
LEPASGLSLGNGVCGFHGAKNKFNIPVARHACVAPIS